MFSLSNMFSINWLHYLCSRLEHFQFSLWQNDLIWLIQANPAGSRYCSSLKSWLSVDEQTEWEWIPAWSVLFLSLSVIVSVSAALMHTHSPCLSRLGHSVMIMWHDTKVQAWCVSYFTLDSMAMTLVWHALYLYNKSIASKGENKISFQLLYCTHV